MKHPLTLAIVIAVAATACSGDDTADPTTTQSTSPPSTTTAPSTVQSTTTTAATTEPSSTVATSTSSSTTESATTAPSTTNPTTVPTGETDWRLVLETLGLRRQDLYRDPDVTRIGEVCTDTGPCAEQLEVQLGDLASKGWHIEGGDPYTVLEAELEDFTGDTLETSDIVTIIAVVQRPADGGRIVDASGEVIADVAAETPEGTNTRGRATLARVGPIEDPWRIVSQEQIGEVPG